MARRNRACPAGVAQHLTQRGNNWQPCCGKSEDFAAYAHPEYPSMSVRNIRI